MVSMKVDPWYWEAVLQGQLSMSVLCFSHECSQTNITMTMHRSNARQRAYMTATQELWQSQYRGCTHGLGNASQKCLQEFATGMAMPWRQTLCR